MFQRVIGKVRHLFYLAFKAETKYTPPSPRNQYSGYSPSNYSGPGHVRGDLYRLGYTDNQSNDSNPSEQS